MNRRGFTLIELLVVIAIIGLLSSVVLASLNTARAKAADAKRYGDLSAISTALEFWYDGHGSYIGRNTSRVSDDLGALVSSGYLPSMPTDPSLTGDNGYRYCAGSSNQYYTLLAQTTKYNGWCYMANGADDCGWTAAFPRCGS